MDIKEIKKRTELLQKANMESVVLISSVAKELGAKVTDLMEYITDNPKLFQTDTVWTYRSKNGYKIRNKAKGLGIKNVYLHANENPDTEEWLIRKIIESQKTIWISEWSNYGTIEGMYVSVDTERELDSSKKHLWRNTPEKIKKLQELGILKSGQFYLGGFGDCSVHKEECVITEDGIRELEELGWTVNR